MITFTVKYFKLVEIGSLVKMHSINNSYIVSLWSLGYQHTSMYLDFARLTLEEQVPLT